MLVLPRKIGESIIINKSIRVKLLGFSKGVGRIGVDAPADTIIDREEVFRRKQREEEARQATKESEDKE